MTPIFAPTCIKAWLEASTHLEKETANQCEYTMVLEIAEPFSLPPEDKAIFEKVDGFLKRHDGHSLNTVINTIFPASLFKKHGTDGVLKHYASIVPRLSEYQKSDHGWGSYAMRLTGEQKDQRGDTFTPLEAIITKLKEQIKQKGPMKAAYELNLVDPVLDIPIYHATTDRKRVRGGPCLSHLSFKLKSDRKLILTAFYRSHFYVQRALGNLFGLAWLQHFVADSVGLETGELVCISSIARLESSKSWNKQEVATLLQQCRDIARATEKGAQNLGQII